MPTTPTEYASLTSADLDKLVVARADRVEFATVATDRHLALDRLHSLALELNARRSAAAAEPFTADEVRAEEALDAYMAGDPNA